MKRKLATLSKIKTGKVINTVLGLAQRWVVDRAVILYIYNNQ